MKFSCYDKQQNSNIVIIYNKNKTLVLGRFSNEKTLNLFK